jgi:hypothetical protein
MIYISSHGFVLFSSVPHFNLKDHQYSSFRAGYCNKLPQLFFICECLFGARGVEGGGEVSLGLNSGLHTCKAVTLPLEPHLQSILLWLLWRWGLVNYLHRLASNHDPPDLTSQVDRITGVSHQHPIIWECLFTSHLRNSFARYRTLDNFFLLAAYCLLVSKDSSLPPPRFLVLFFLLV